MMHIDNTEQRTHLMRRLKRIEGQVRGIQTMLDEERDCRDILQQVTAVRSAMHSVGIEVMRVYATQCLHDPDSTLSDEEMINYMLKMLT